MTYVSLNRIFKSEIYKSLTCPKSIVFSRVTTQNRPVNCCLILVHHAAFCWTLTSEEAVKTKPQNQCNSYEY